MEFVFGDGSLSYYLSLVISVVALFIFIRFSYTLATKSDVLGSKLFFMGFLMFIVFGVLSTLFYDPETSLVFSSIFELLGAISVLLAVLGFKRFVTELTASS